MTSGDNLLLIEKMTVKELREALKRTQTVILPLGGTEQHGYHLPLNTDVITATEMAKAAAVRTNALVAPTVSYSFSGGELTGTVDASLHATANYLRDISRSLANTGFKNIILLAGHGGSENLRDIREGLKVFLRQEKKYRDVAIFAPCVLDLSDTWKKYIAKQNYHADAVETALIMHLRPDLVKKDMPTDKPKIMNVLLENPDNYQVPFKHTDSEFEIPHISQNSDIEIGVMGDPSLASPELGRQVFEECVETIVSLVNEAETARK